MSPEKPEVPVFKSNLPGADNDDLREYHYMHDPDEDIAEMMAGR